MLLVEINNNNNDNNKDNKSESGRAPTSYSTPDILHPSVWCAHLEEDGTLGLLYANANDVWRFNFAANGLWWLMLQYL